ncbi:MAG: type II secretion system F family protein [Halorhodospira sp.]
MARLSWRGVDRHGRRLHGSCHADSATVLVRVLEARGIAVLRTHRELRLLPRRSTPRSAEQATALRQLASLLEAGAPFDEALRTLAQQQAHRLRESLRHVRLGVEHGEDPATAFSRALPGLSQAHTALLHAGLWTGDLPGALRSVAAEIERQEAILHQLRRAATYPAIVAGTVLALLTLLLLVVVPRFEAIFAQGGQSLPQATRLVIAAADAFALAAPILFGVAATTAGVLLPLGRRWPTLRQRLGAALRRIPGIRPLVHDAALSRWCGILARLLGAGVPLLDALPQATGAGYGTALEPGMERLAQHIAVGEPLAVAVRSKLPQAPEAAQLIAVGEATGRLEEMLSEASELYQGRLEARLQRLAGLLEPSLILLLGAITAGVVAALYLPVFEMGGTL